MQNIGILDKTIRLIIAAIWIYVFGFVCLSWWWLVGLVPLLTAVYGYCPLYKFFGINTCKKCKKEERSDAKQKN